MSVKTLKSYAVLIDIKWMLDSMQIGKQLGRGKRARNYTCDTSESKDCRLNVIEKTCFMLCANHNLSNLMRGRIGIADT